MADLGLIVLAAGKGTRMLSDRPKVMHQAAGRSLLGHVLDTAAALAPARLVVVAGPDMPEVADESRKYFKDAQTVIQGERQGTAHAVSIAAPHLADFTGKVLVLYGDVPLISHATLRDLTEAVTTEQPLAVLAFRATDPSGYGRLIIGRDGIFTGIREELDATPEERAVNLCNSGVMAVDSELLCNLLPQIGNNNAKGEYYLTDTIAIAREDGLTVGAYPVEDVRQTEGVNDRVQLARMGAEMNRRIVEAWMREGVTVMDPATTWIDSDVVLAADVTILPGTQLLGATVVGEDAVVGPDCTLKDCEIGAGARVVRTHGELAVIGGEAKVGPYAHLRPGTNLGAGGKIGGFVETKNAAIGDGAKVPHLSYVGDAEIGEGANIGAGTIFANYDGVRKHRTKVGRHAKTASNSTFVAPVEIGDGAGTGAGTVVRRDVPPGALAVSSGPQRNIEEWALKKRDGTAQAEAAAEALGARRDGDQDVAES